MGDSTPVIDEEDIEDSGFDFAPIKKNEEKSKFNTEMGIFIF